jgi:hypothetical protein
MKEIEKPVGYISKEDVTERLTKKEKKKLQLQQEKSIIPAQ